MSPPPALQQLSRRLELPFHELQLLVLTFLLYEVLYSTACTGESQLPHFRNVDPPRGTCGF
jgi:hypothetical protein